MHNAWMQSQTSAGDAPLLGGMRGLVMNAPRCRTCHAPVIWATTERGGSMILDAEPVADGEWVVSPQGEALHVKTSSVFADLVNDPKYPTPRYRAHWATCPDAKAWRAKRAQTEAAR